MPIIGNPIYQSAFVVDQFSGNGSTVAFTMSVAPAGVTNVLVAVSGVLQDPSTYGVVGNTITFSAAPPSGTGNISCRYLGVPASGVTTTAYRTVTEFTATAGQTTFTPPSYSVGFINVYLNGVLLGSADYTATNGTTVVLATGASAGNLLTVESFLISSVANAIANAAGSVSNTNLATNSVTTDKIASGVTINFADGSASTPSITNDGDTNTGIFFPAADTIAFAEGGTESMRITSTGTVAIGTTTTPTAKLWVESGRVGLSNTYKLGWHSNPAHGDLNNYITGDDGSNYVAIGTSAVERMRINASGYITMPAQPVFSAYIGTGATTSVGVSATQKIPCTAVVNISGSFNNSTYRFTAPITGSYQFNTNVEINASASGRWGVSFFKNGSVYVSDIEYYDAPGAQWQNASMSCVIPLNVGDYVELYTESVPSGASVWYSPNPNGNGNFSGYLIG